MNRAFGIILELLQEKEYVTASQIAEILNISIKTVRTRIRECNEEIQKYGAQILAKQNAGYYQVITDKEKYSAWRQAALENHSQLPNSSEDRVQWLLIYLLNREDYIKIDDICEFLYISRNTLTADLKQVETILAMYHLQVIRKSKYGICVEGSEFHKRICLASFLLNRNRFIMESMKQKDEVAKIAQILKRTLKKYNLKIAETSFDNMVFTIYVSNSRMQRGFPMIYTEEETTEIKKEVSEQLWHVTEGIASELKESMSVIYSENEKCHLALHLNGKISSDSLGRQGMNLVISNRIDELVMRILYEVYKINGLDFTNNLELRMSLNQHMVPLDVRMKYDMPLTNPILVEIKKAYSFAYTIAMTAALVLQDYYQKPISEDEIGYIAMLFALAIEKIDKKIDKKNIIVVCASGRGSSQLFMYKYTQTFEKYINKVYACTVFELETYDFQTGPVDYIFTTVPLTMPLPVPVFEISMFISDYEVVNYRRMFERGDNAFLYCYYASHLFIPHLQAETKEEALKKMCEHLDYYDKIPEGFYEAVLKREQMGQTDFGNYVAIPHPCKVMTKDRFAMVAILEHPIWWGHYEVQVIMLLSLSIDDNMEVDRFYEFTMRFVLDKERVKKVIQNPQFDKFMELLMNET